MVSPYLACNGVNGWVKKKSLPLSAQRLLYFFFPGITCFGGRNFQIDQQTKIFSGGKKKNKNPEK